VFNSATVYYKASSSPLPVAWQPGPALASSGQQGVAMAAGSALQSCSQLRACQPKQLSLASQNMWCANPDSLPAFFSPSNAAVHLRVPVAGHVAPAPAAQQPAAGKAMGSEVCGGAAFAGARSPAACITPFRRTGANPHHLLQCMYHVRVAFLWHLILFAQTVVCRSSPTS